LGYWWLSRNVGLLDRCRKSKRASQTDWRVFLG
jgi:hypothetical protein